MPKRSFAAYSGYEPGRIVASRGESGRTVFNEARAVSRFASRRRYVPKSRLLAGRGFRPGSYMLRRYRPLRSALSSSIETKYYDTSKSAAALAAGGDWTGKELNPTTELCLNAPQQGTGATNRDGRFITMQSIEVTGSIYQAPQANQTAADTSPVVTLALVLDTQTNGGTATGLDAELVYINPVNNAAANVTPLRNMLYTKRFKVLKVWSAQLNQLTSTYDGTNMEQNGNITTFKMFCNLKNLKTEFLGNAGTVADITDNALFLIGTTAEASTVPTLYYNARLRFRG